jgi:2'-5' RNA ligase
MRAFTAVDIQDRELLLELEKIQSELDFGFNLVPPEKMHITLQFFQDIEDEEAEQIIEAMKNIEVDPFSLEIRGAGVFPSKDYIRVVWTGIESGTIHDLKEQVSNHEVEPDNNHEFHPHVTLARVDSISRTEKQDFRKKLEELQDKKIGELEVDSVKLFESIHVGDGTEYRELEEVKL